MNRTLRTTLFAAPLLLLTACAPTAIGQHEQSLTSDAPAPTAPPLTYGELAATKVGPALRKVIAGVRAFTAATLPNQAKDLRKQLGEARDYLDLFPYAYPTDGATDSWKALRADLDVGYETIGAFKDLYDAQGIDDPSKAVYDPDDLRARRDPALAWTTHFGGTDVAAAYQRYAEAPSPDQLYDRDPDDLSKFFWGEVKTEPSAKRSGLANLGRLARALLKLADKDFADLKGLTHITRTKNHDQFHNFRKRVRSIAKVARYFPGITESGQDSSTLLGTLDEVVDRYGEINDKISAYDLAVEHKDDDAPALAADIEQRWDALQTWQKQQDLAQIFDDLRAIILKD